MRTDHSSFLCVSLSRMTSLLWDQWERTTVPSSAWVCRVWRRYLLWDQWERTTVPSSVWVCRVWRRYYEINENGPQFLPLCEFVAYDVVTMRSMRTDHSSFLCVSLSRMTSLLTMRSMRTDHSSFLCVSLSRMTSLLWDQWERTTVPYSVLVCRVWRRYLLWDQWERTTVPSSAWVCRVWRCYYEINENGPQFLPLCEFVAYDVVTMRSMRTDHSSFLCVSLSRMTSLLWDQWERTTVPSSVWVCRVWRRYYEINENGPVPSSVWVCRVWRRYYEINENGPQFLPLCEFVAYDVVTYYEINENGPQFLPLREFVVYDVVTYYEINENGPQFLPLCEFVAYDVVTMRSMRTDHSSFLCVSLSRMTSLLWDQWERTTVPSSVWVCRVWRRYLLWDQWERTTVPSSVWVCRVWRCYYEINENGPQFLPLCEFVAYDVVTMRSMRTDHSSFLCVSLSRMTLLLWDQWERTTVPSSALVCRVWRRYYEINENGPQFLPLCEFVAYDVVTMRSMRTDHSSFLCVSLSRMTLLLWDQWERTTVPSSVWVCRVWRRYYEINENGPQFLPLREFVAYDVVTMRSMRTDHSSFLCVSLSRMTSLLWDQWERTTVPSSAWVCRVWRRYYEINENGPQFLPLCEFVAYDVVTYYEINENGPQFLPLCEFVAYDVVTMRSMRMDHSSFLCVSLSRMTSLLWDQWERTTVPSSAWVCRVWRCYYEINENGPQFLPLCEFVAYDVVTMRSMRTDHSSFLCVSLSRMTSLLWDQWEWTTVPSSAWVCRVWRRYYEINENGPQFLPLCQFVAYDVVTYYEINENGPQFHPLREFVAYDVVTMRSMRTDHSSFLCVSLSRMTLLLWDQWERTTVPSSALVCRVWRCYYEINENGPQFLPLC